MSAKPSKKNDPEAQPSASADASANSRLPFEPAQTRKKIAKKPAAVSPKAESTEKSSTHQSPSMRQYAEIPKVVSQRMVRRMAFFCGIPTSLGMLTLLVSYIVITNHWYKLPNVAVLLVNLGFFGLGVLGLSYGALSASWDENRLGNWFGWNEFTTNFARLTESWQTTKQKPDA